MTTISDLPGDLAAEILSKLPITSLSAVRSTCKRWNSLSKTQVIFNQEASRKQFLGFMVIDYKVCSLRFNLHGLRNNGKFVDPSIKQISKLNQAISQVFHCNGLLLCVTRDISTLLIWNPYLGQTRMIQPREKFHSYDRYALGYDINKHNHKILRIFYEHETGKHVFRYEIYNCSSDSWRVLDITPDWLIPYYQRGVSLKNRNTYFVAREELEEAENEIREYIFLVCFDFTTESFGPRLPVPFHSYLRETVTISCVREEKLALLCQLWGTSPELKIWVSTKIETNTVSWSMFLKINERLLTGFSLSGLAGSFFIHEEEKVAVVFDLDKNKPPTTNTCRYHTAYILGQDGYYKPVNIGEATNLHKSEIYFVALALVCSSYVPSLVQLQTNQPCNKKIINY